TVVVPELTCSAPGPPSAPAIVRDADTVSCAGAATLHDPASVFGDPALSVSDPASTFTSPSASTCENQLRVPPTTSIDPVCVTCTSDCAALQLKAPAPAATSSSCSTRNVDPPEMQTSPALQVQSTSGRIVVP